MSVLQKLIKIFAVAFATFLTFVIVTSIVGAVYAIVHVAEGINGGDAFMENRKTTNLSEVWTAEQIQENGIHSIYIDCPYNVNIVAGTELKVDAREIPETYRLECKNGRISLEDKQKGGVFVFSFYSDGSLSKASVTVTVPESFQPKLLELDSGSGSVAIQDVSCQELVLDSGSGSLDLQNVSCQSFHVDSGSGRVMMQKVSTERTELDTGSGNVQISDSNLGTLHLDSGSGRIFMEQVTAEEVDVKGGSGKIEYTGTLTGNCRVRSGSGPIVMNLKGNVEDYSISVDSGSGGCYLNGRKTEDGTYGENIRGKLLFHSGSGRVTVDFED